MKKLIIILTSFVVFAFATNTISVVSGTVANETSQITVDFLLENTDDVGGFQFDLIGDPDVLTGAGVSTEVDGMTVAGSVQGDGSYRLICYSMSAAFYPAEFNDIACSVTFDVNSNMTEESVFIDIVAGSLVIADQFGDALDGDFVGGDFYFSGDAPAPIISVEPGELTFTPTVIGESVTEILTISNVGNMDLNIFAISVNDAALFETDFGTPFTLAPDATYDLSVTYNTPVDDFGFGTMSNLHIINDSGVADKQVPMQVMSVPDLTVEPASLDFDTVQVGTDTTLSFVITNTGTEDLMVKIVASGDDPVIAFAWAPEMTSYTTLLMGESETIEVTISGDALSGNHTGTLEIWRANLAGADEVLDETVSLSVNVAPYTPQIWYISTTGSDTNDGSAENPFATIQHGLNTAGIYDTVLVAAGTYYENITWPATNGIKLIGEDRETTIIDGNQQASV
ncbi:choice-of-anchor D domain-containing protein, partial [bacterium]|nr:choice-of-anchor D domain-containing protein [bacterium]